MVQDARTHLTYIAEPLRHLAVPLSELTLDPSNARKHNERNLAAIAGSLKRFGQRFPIVVQRQGMVVRAGNGRLMAAKQLGWSHLACVVVDESEVEAVAFAISDNRTSELAEWDDETLTRLLESLPSEMLEVTGFCQAELDELIDELRPAEVTEDEAPEPPSTPVSRKGDVWILGNHRLLCGSGTAAEDVAVAMGGAKGDLLLTDPPYGVSYQSKLSVEEAVARRRRTDGLDLQNDDLDAKGTYELVRDSLKIAADHLRPGAAFYVCSPSGDMALTFRLALRDAGLALRQVVIWVKDVFVMGRQDYHWRHEDILYGWKEGGAHYFVDDRTQDTVWEVKRPKRSEEHPTMKPVELMARAVANSSKRGGIVYEPFSGSGTTLIACEQLGRHCRAIEIDPRFIDVAVIRWQQLTGEQAVLEGGGETFAAVTTGRTGEESAKPLTDKTDRTSSGTSHKRETPAVAGVGGKG
jgi:DNA modification methylase